MLSDDNNFHQLEAKLIRLVQQLLKDNRAAGSAGADTLRIKVSAGELSSKFTSRTK